MPQWGRPPGAQLGGSARRRATQLMDNNVRMEEIDSGGEDGYLLRGGRALYAEQRRIGLPRRNVNYEDFAGDAHLVDGMDYDLYDDSDSTVAYAVQLAMKDKEEWLVDKALERIRRAQTLGQKQVRLSKRELDALERKRLQTGGGKDVGQRHSASKASSIDDRRSRPMGSSTSGGLGGTEAVRNGSTASLANGSPHNKDTYGLGARVSATSVSDQASASPQTPNIHSLRPQRSSAPMPPSLPCDYRWESYLSVPSGYPPMSLPNPFFAPPLPRDPHWVPPYQVPYPVRSQNVSGSEPYQSSYRSVRHPLGPQPAPTALATGDSSEDDNDSGSDENVDQRHSVDVVQRQVPTGSRSRPATASGVGVRAVPSRIRRS